MGLRSRGPTAALNAGRGRRAGPGVGRGERAEGHELKRVAWDAQGAETGDGRTRGELRHTCWVSCKERRDMQRAGRHRSTHGILACGDGRRQVEQRSAMAQER